MSHPKFHVNTSFLTPQREPNGAHFTEPQALAWIVHAIFSNQPLGVSPGLWMSRELMQYPG